MSSETRIVLRVMAGIVGLGLLMFLLLT